MTASRPSSSRSILLTALILIAIFSGCTTQPVPIPVYEWPFASGTSDGRRASKDPTITSTSLHTLGIAWTFDTKGAVTGTPTVQDGRVFAATWLGQVVAVKVSDGQLVWSREVGAKITGSITLHEGLALFGDSKARLHAVRQSTGEPVWNRTLDEALNAHLYATPLVVPATAERAAFIIQAVGSDQESLSIHDTNPVTFRGSIVALDLVTGEQLWRTWLSPEGLFGAPVWGTPVLVPGTDLVVFGTGNAYVAPAAPMTDAIVALNLSDGAVAWFFQATKDDVFTHLNPISRDDDFGSTPSVIESNGTTLVVIGQKSSIVWAVDAATGKVEWTEGSVSKGEGIIGDTAANDGLVFVPYVTLKKVAAIDPATGTSRWNRSLDGLGFADPVAVAGAVIVADTSGNVTGLESSTGRVLWSDSIGEGGVYGGLSVAAGHLFVPVVRDHFLGDAGALVAFAPGRSPATSVSASRAEEPGEVRMLGFEFVPGVKTIHVGDNVTWANDDPTFHTVTFEDPYASTYSEREVQPGNSTQITFNEVGTFSYYCRPHASQLADGSWSGMTGTVVVMPLDSG